MRVHVIQVKYLFILFFLSHVSLYEESLIYIFFLFGPSSLENCSTILPIYGIRLTRSCLYVYLYTQATYKLYGLFQTKIRFACFRSTCLPNRLTNAQRYVYRYNEYKSIERFLILPRNRFELLLWKRASVAHRLVHTIR